MDPELYPLLTLTVIGWVVLLLLMRYDEKKERRKKREAEKKAYEKAAKHFRDDMTSDDLADVALKVGKRIRRINAVSVKGHKVACKVLAQSGLSTWGFTVDFDSHGHMSSKYTVRSENEDSDIPAVFAERVAQQIRSWEPTRTDEPEESGGEYMPTPYCPYCGAKAGAKASYCSTCGAELPLVPVLD